MMSRIGTVLTLLEQQGCNRTSSGMKYGDQISPVIMHSFLHGKTSTSVAAVFGGGA